MKNKIFAYLMQILVFCSILCALMATPALAVDDPAASTETDDLSAAYYYLDYYAFFDLSDAVFDAQTMAELEIALAECDPWSEYYTAEEYAAFSAKYEGEYVGVGIEMSMNKQGEIVVVNVFEGGGAAKVGIKAGDIIVALDDISIEGMSLSDVKIMLGGDGVSGSMVKITVRRDDVEYSFNVARLYISIPTISYKMMENGIGYLNIFSFTKETADQVYLALKVMDTQGMKAIVLDLRNNPGGLLQSAADVAALLTGEAPSYFMVNLSGYIDFYASKYTEDPFVTQPLAVLVNENTASAAEMLTAVIQDRKRGSVIGTATYGKGVYQVAVPLPSGGALYFTSGKYITIGLQDVMKQGGIVPDVLVTDADAQMNKAVQWLATQQSAASQLILAIGSHQSKVDGKSQPVYSAPFISNSCSYVSAAETLKMLGWEMNCYGGKWYCFNGVRRMILDVPAKRVLTGKFSAAVIVRDGVSFIPASFLRNAGYMVSWDTTARAVMINRQL